MLICAAGNDCGQLGWNYRVGSVNFFLMKTPACRSKEAGISSARHVGWLSFLVWLSLAAPAPAASFLSTEADFLEYVGASQSFVNGFSDLVEENPYVHPINYSSNGLAYEITSSPVFEIYSRTGFVSTASSSAEIVVSFTRTNVHAAGGQVFLTDAFGAPTNGEVRVVLDNANIKTLSISSGQPAFAGFFTGGAPFTAFRVRSQTPGAYPGLDQFWVAEGVPVLTIAPSGPSAVAIRWPAPATGYVLQFSLTLSNPNWADVQAIPQPSGYFREVMVAVQDSALFLRLVRR